MGENSLSPPAVGRLGRLIQRLIAILNNHLPIRISNDVLAVIVAVSHGEVSNPYQIQKRVLRAFT